MLLRDHHLGNKLRALLHSVRWGFVVSCVLLTTVAFAQPPDSLWSRVYGGSDDDWCLDAQQTRDGGYVLAGQTRSFSDIQSAWLVKTNADGDSLWSHTYGGNLQAGDPCRNAAR